MKKQSRQSIGILKEGYSTSVEGVRTMGDRKELKFKTNTVNSRKYIT